MLDSFDCDDQQQFEESLPAEEDEPPDQGMGEQFGADVVMETRQFIRARPARNALGKFDDSKPGMCFTLGEQRWVTIRTISQGKYRW